MRCVFIVYIKINSLKNKLFTKYDYFIRYIIFDLNFTMFFLSVLSKRTYFLQKKETANNVFLRTQCERHLSARLPFTRVLNPFYYSSEARYFFPRRSYSLLSRNGEMYSRSYCSSYFLFLSFRLILLFMCLFCCSRRIQTRADTYLHRSWIYSRGRAKRQLKSVTICYFLRKTSRTHFARHSLTQTYGVRREPKIKKFLIVSRL